MTGAPTNLDLRTAAARLARRPLWRGSSPTLSALSLLCALAWTFARPAPVTAEEKEKGPPKHYNIEVFQGPVVSSQRVVGMGGAFIGLAEGVAGHLDNPAAFAVRSPFSGNEAFDWDFGTVIFDVVGTGVDFDMSGSGNGYDDALVLQGGANVKLGRFGVGLHLSQTSFLLPRHDEHGKAFNYAWQQRSLGLGLAYAFADGQWVAGLILGTSNAAMANSQTRQSLQMSDAFFSLPDTWGLLWAPQDRPWRLGATLKLPVVMTQENAASFSGAFSESLGKLVVPGSVTLPWSFGVGGATMVWGERPMNVRPGYGQIPLPSGALASDKVPRRYLLVTADLVLTGPTSDGIGVQGWLAQEVQRAGMSPTLSLRGGAEGEVLPGWLVLRAGSYVEPSRFAGRVGRIHATGGFDVKIPVYFDWQLTVVADVASGYQNLAFGLGMWR